MTAHITLKAAHFGKDQTITVFPHWISNGHWAIRRDSIANSGLFASEAVVKAAFPRLRTVRIQDSDSMIERIMPAQTAVKAFTISHWTYEGLTAPIGRFALAIHGAEHSYLNRDHLEILRVSSGAELWSAGARETMTDATNPDDRTFLLMPAVIDKSGAHLTPLVSLIHLLDLQTDNQMEVA